jgi:hypothetical protein
VEDHSKNHPVTAAHIGSDTVTGCSYTTLSDSTFIEGHACFGPRSLEGICQTAQVRLGREDMHQSIPAATAS